MLKHLRRVVLLTGILYLSIITPALADDFARYDLRTGQTVETFEQFQECDVCPEMIVMPLGSFMMGAGDGESWAAWWDENDEGPVAYDARGNPLYTNPNEQPQHEVLIDIPFAMGINEVTHAEWMRCVREGGCGHTPDHRELTMTGYVKLGPDHPVIDVSLRDIEEYVVWLNARVGADVYRLPTEAEWEYAARAGTTTRFAQGKMITTDQANFLGAFTNEYFANPYPNLIDRETPVPVQMLDAANPWGLRHMSGNVSELTLSCYTKGHLGLPTSSTYLAHAADGCDRYVAKGGAHHNGAEVLRLAARESPTVDNRSSNDGFRLLRIFPTKGPLS